MNIFSKSFFILSFLFLINHASKLHGMNSTKPLNEQCYKTGYKTSNYLSEVNTTSKKNPQLNITLYFRQYTKKMKFMNIPWFKHIYKTKEKAELNNMGHATSYKQKKLVFTGYDLAQNSFTQTFLIGAFAAPWLYNCFWK